MSDQLVYMPDLAGQALKQESCETDLGRQVMMAATDEALFTELVKRYSRHIKFTASKTAGHFITESDDEWSVALSAFHEAVTKYDPERGSFLSFADVVIKRRLLDEYRRSVRTVEEVPLEEKHSEIAAPETDLKYEIEALSAQLEPYNITFSDLVTASPKAEKTRKACALVIHCLTSEPALMYTLRKSHALPAGEIRKICGVPPKILERHRKYIIAAAEIICSDLPCLQEYVKTIRKEGEHESNCNGI